MPCNYSDSDSCYSSSSCSSSDYTYQKCKKKKKCYYRPPYCPKPCFGKQLAAKLCPGKEVPPVENSCAHGYASGVLNNKNTCFKYCVKVFDLSSDLLVPSGTTTAAHFHKAPPCENGPVLKDICLKKYKQPPRGYDDYGCGCKYVYVAKGKWSCDDKTQPLTANDVEFLVCGLVYINVHTVNNPNGEVRGQLCCYDDEPW